MAPALKLWLGIALGGIALVTVATLPPSVTDVRMPPPRLPEEIRASSLFTDAARTGRFIRRMRWMDSLPALAMATQVDGLAVGGHPGLVDDQQLALVRGLLRAELADVPRGDPRTVIGFFVQRTGFAGETNDFIDARPHWELHAGELDGAPYCLVLHVRAERILTGQLGIRRDLDGKLHGELLNGCRLVASYGLPGPAIRDWLARGGYQYAEWGTTAPRTGAPVDAGLRTSSGRRVFSVDRVGLTPERCMVGDADACARLFLHDTEDRMDASSVTYEIADFPTSLGSALMWSDASILTESAHYLLSDLEQEYGRDAFRDFWTSERDVPAAFEQAFGVAVGPWVRRWVGVHLRLERYGPSLPRGGWLGTVLLVLLSTLAAGVWHHGRAVA